jgi:hypothetical protein
MTNNYNIIKWFNVPVILSLMLVMSVLSLTGQKTGHEWINPDQHCIKIKVANDGIYRITQEVLKTTSLKDFSFEAKHLKLVNFGEVRALYTSTSGIMDENDYIEFYAVKNTIGLDSMLYKDWRTDLFNPEYSMVNDTNAYFLCISKDTPNLRYTEVNQDIAGFTGTPWTYYLHQEKVIFSNSYFKNVDGDIRYSNFEPSEGYGDVLRQTSNTNVSVSNLIADGPLAVLSFRAGANSHLQRISVSLNNVPKDTIISLPKKNIVRSYTLSPEDVKSVNTLTIRNTDPNDRHRLALVSLEYPRAFQFGGSLRYSFMLEAHPGQRLLEISGFKTEGGKVRLYDNTNNILYNTLITGENSLKALVNPSAGRAEYLLVNEQGGLQEIAGIETLSEMNLSDEGQDYIIITNKALRGGPVDYVREYADFRSSTAGGSYKVREIDIREIYDYFGYGIDRHFYGVKNFSKFMKDQWPSVKFVLIIGKGIEYTFSRTPNDLIGVVNRTFHVPTYGYPGSDNMLFSEGDFPDPYFAIGRIAARDGNDIKNYLNKLKEYIVAPLAAQTIEDKYWMKRVLHLGGGNTAPEQTAIRNGLSSMESIIESSDMAAEVNSFFKTSTDVLQSATSAQIKNIINNGVNMITFFGHSGVGTFDFSLENPREYKNDGKYPLINSMGCYSGNIHTSQRGISESFILEDSKGAIGFLASAGTAFIGSLTNYGREFYNNIGTIYYGTSIGEINRIMANKYRNELFSNLAFYQQMTFHGDPAVSLYHTEGPDFVFDYNTVRTSPSLISSSTQSFELQFDIVNLGKKTGDSLDVRFLYQLPSGRNADTINLRIPAPLSRAGYSAVFVGGGVDGIGRNIIFGEIDPGQLMAEVPDPAAKFNNRLNSGVQDGYSFYILDNTAFPVYPDKYAIVGNNNITLLASASNAFLAKTRFIFEIDSTALFNSPLKKRTEVLSEGGLISWPAPLNFQPNTVYYWRVSPDSINPDVGYLWQTSSFIYIPSEAEGWNQSHYFQYLANNGANTININQNRKFEFPPSEYFVQFRNGLYEEQVIGYRVNLGIRFTSIRPWLFTTGGAVSIVIQDPSDDTPVNPGGFVNNNGGAYGSISTGLQATRRNFAFKTETPEDRKKVMDFIENIIPEGSFVTFFTVMNKATDNIFPEMWDNDVSVYGKSLFSVLESQGAQQIRTMADVGTLPYTFMFQKGVKPLAEKLAVSPEEIIESQMSVPRKGQEGVLKTIEIGNASSWERIEYKLTNRTSSDTVLLRIIGIDNNNSESKLAENIISESVDISDINAAIYPRLRLEFNIKDSERFDVPDFNHIRVFYTGFTDIAIDPLSAFSFQKDSLDQGDTFRFKVALRNISSVATDSVEVKYSLIKTDDNSELNMVSKYGKVSPGDTIEVAFRQDTRSMKGEYLFVTEANPSRKFAEKYYFNNIGKRQFKVLGDSRNPLLQVYFDGVQIMDGDIISPKPEIRITLKDDNPFLLINNPELFTLKIDTGRNQIITIQPDDPRIQFEPQKSPSDFATLRFNPEFRTGDYKLIVQASDESGNFSAVNDKSVNFRVIEKESVSNVFNYPNPFSTSTQFVFTLTGDKIPDIFSISIMTLSGKVVREIKKEELGHLKIGTNRTPFKWDGTDEYGSKLANGVYLYKVNVRKEDGGYYEQFDIPKTDSFFREGFGKLVIMR